ncbi:MAG: hypothetical protein OXO52_05570 [Rhodospirillales bacterium]|nr:hypothetical protein [Rhodospirillales bacterium]
MNENARCPIWGTPATEYSTRGGDRRAIDSPRAGGRYFITGRAESVLQGQDASVKARLTTWLIDQRRLGVDHPEVNPDTIKQTEARRTLHIRERADRYLRYVGNLEPYPGFNFPAFTPRVAPEDFLAALAWLESSVDPTDEDGQTREMGFFERYLEQRGWVEFQGGSSGGRLTVEGHVRLAELEAAHTPSSRAFVAMWFDDSMSEAWDRGIAPAVRDTGYDPVRIDRKEHVNKIDDEIVAEIRRARFVVADFTHGDTGARGGVYYEAGFAHGLGIPVIFSCREDRLGQVHFDTRQYNHIVWETPADLRDQLAKRIAAVLGDGPNAPPGSASG